jgi:hypothetical protein
MPVKIQELVIQTRVKSDSGSADKSNSPKATQQDLMRLERRLEYICLQAMKGLLGDKQER